MNKMSGHPLKQTQTVLDDGRPQENNPFESFFGPLPPGLVPVRSDAMYPYSSHALPFAYQGRNYFLASVLDFLITSEDNFLTANDGVCPFVKTDEIHVQWNTFTFNRCVTVYCSHALPAAKDRISHVVLRVAFAAELWLITNPSTACLAW